MKLLISVVNLNDLDPLIDALVDAGYRATIINTTGGFLREGNATLLIGLTDDCVSAALEIIRANCCARVRQISAWPAAMEGEKPDLPTPIEVRVGGGIVFIADMERFERY
jgi:uncharacterized protein YaaQ